MRHGNKGRKLKRTASHRAATLNSLATSLLRHKKITTTEAKAKETRVFVEPIITRAKKALALNASDATTASRIVHARREVARNINDEEVVKSLFSEIAPKVANRAGGYTRVVKLGQRHGDNAHMAIIELVDFAVDATAGAEAKTAAAKPRPTRNKARAAAVQAEANAASTETAAPKKPRATRKKKDEGAE
jgi:large subunit ribosomal protein L17